MHDIVYTIQLPLVLAALEECEIDDGNSQNADLSLISRSP